jgi:hypothetical protein
MYNNSCTYISQYKFKKIQFLIKSLFLKPSKNE